VSDQVKNINNGAFEENIDLYEGIAPKKALEDVMQVLSYFYKYHKKICSGNKSLREYIVFAVVSTKGASIMNDVLEDKKIGVEVT